MSFIKKAQKKIELRARRRVNRVRNAQESRGVKPRISIFRSLNNIYAQVIDDKAQKTLFSFSSLNLNKNEIKNLNKKAVAKKVGQELGKLAVAKSVTQVFFDRGIYLYHGRVQALAEGLRESGLQF